MPHQIFIYSFKILIWENPIAILPSGKHQTEAEIYCRAQYVAVRHIPNIFWGLTSPLFGSWLRGNLQVLFGLAREIDLCWYLEGFLQQLLPSTDSEWDRELCLQPLQPLSAHLERSPSRKALLSGLNTCPLTEPLRCLCTLEGCECFWRNGEKCNVSRGRGSPVQNFSGRCYSVHTPCEGKAFDTDFPQIKALRISSLVQKHLSQTLGNWWPCEPCSSPWKAQRSCGTHHLYLYSHPKSSLVLTHIPSPTAHLVPLQQSSSQTCTLLSAAHKNEPACSSSRLGHLQKAAVAEICTYSIWAGNPFA